MTIAPITGRHRFALPLILAAITVANILRDPAAGAQMLPIVKITVAQLGLVLAGAAVVAAIAAMLTYGRGGRNA